MTRLGREHRWGSPWRGPSSHLVEEPRVMMEMERSRLLEALRAIAWNISRDAPGLGIPRSTGL